MHPEEAVGEAGGVGEQVPDPHRLAGRDRDLPLVRTAGVDADMGEGGDERADRIGELEGALLVEHHRGDRGDRLGHRVDAPQRVRLHRQPGFDVARPVAGHMCQVAPPAHRHQPAGQAAVVHVPGEVPVDPPQPFRVQAHLGRVNLGLESAHATASRLLARRPGTGRPRLPSLALILRAAPARGPVQGGPPGC